jgi:hypothetical protein
MSTVQIIVIVVLVVVVVLLGATAWMAVRRRSLRQRFGPEYDRVVTEQDSRLAAERELRARERRHAELDLRPLSEESRSRYATAWEEIQAKFVDAPNDAVGDADRLVTELIAERGYPTENYEEQLAHLSVEHARTLEHYRDAHEINMQNERGEASTEQLRMALVHYRALFSELLGKQPDAFRAEPAAAAESANEPTAAAESAVTREPVVDREPMAPAQRTEATAEPDEHPAEATVPATDERSSDARPERTS